jgi:transcriptional regulator with XRE-family HTH domain
VTVSGERIRQARVKNGMRQLDLAHEIGVSERNVVRWENNHHAPRADTLAAIAKATGQDLAFFFGEDEEDAHR